MSDADFPFKISDHARQTVLERGIDLDWVARVMQNPAVTHLDKSDVSVRHALAKIPEYGDRVLRVIYNHTTSPQQIVTAFFDRRMKGRL